MKKITGKISYLWILALGFLLRLIGIFQLDLGEWDERYHALVAKNLMIHPLKPALITDGLLPLNALDWSMCDVWLAKPPLAMWLMAVSIKIFGVNELGLRLPSIIISLGSLYLTYKIGKKLFNKTIALWAVFFYAVNGLLYEINTGIIAGDHVDTLFFFLFQLSIFIIIQDKPNETRSTSTQIGILTGLAFLTKWTMACFIPLVIIPIFWLQSKRIQDVIVFVAIMVIFTTCTAAPWLVYIVYHFPDETSNILHGMVTPVTEVIQEHGGVWYYYLNTMRINIHEGIYLPLLFLIFFLWKKPSQKLWILAIWIGLPLVLLSIFATKREVYLMMLATPFFLTMGYFLDVLYHLMLMEGRKILAWALPILFVLISLRYTVERVKPWVPRGVKPTYRSEIERVLSSAKVPADSIILVNEPHYIEARFYYGVIGYRYVSDQDIDLWTSKGYKVFSWSDGNYLSK